MKKIVVILLFSFLFIGCSSARKSLVKKIDSSINSDDYNNQFTGFLLVDIESRDTIYNVNSTKYFTPASNTKIFTLYTSLKLLPERIPALKYIEKKDTLFVEGTGDPSFLHPSLNDSTAFKFLEKHDNVALHLDNFNDAKFGPGWSWDDYHYYYSAERNGFPVFGNILTIQNSDSLNILPSFFQDSIIDKEYYINRELEQNTFYFNSTQKDTVEIPLMVQKGLTKNLLENILKKEVRLVSGMPSGEKKVLYGIQSDSVFRRMMEVSDNFLAEQLLIVGSSTLSDTLNSKKSRDFILKNHLSGLRQPPRWVDGSGLSRYNLFTPESMVHILQKLYSEIPKERLFQFFPTGGVSGTIEDWYAGNTKPYIYAKTGSLGNNHCLSGYLITNSGKTLVFSFMNNHFMESSSVIKERMQTIFEEIRDNY
ncbi:D-alanyl-D-alanine carboxypeptidase/D-alanyl-D-alanine-endopeptidase [Maribacter sp. HTCC2170]|uniref:D-alanyl-D-alanine carboxypeptidase/D-alanyl-D-alanine-endopeptidase n=1 Tax=Maribacter sp. (strain HTCC2170 / KCCM 42371) TaxID=313603 RepID=UPI00006B4783|nr:D-alanyl-D-alanine carboxypeptidase [Maribacter sp. HTCC2170]EAR01716.1 D-alanyl-D-alanine carboxypeptidase/D-alanyl-D-alanine-endopeptidase [Maribacter sp. HTCC2170]